MRILDNDVNHNHMKPFPEVDSPKIFDLHWNSDLTFRVKEVNELLHTLDETQPKEEGGDDDDGMWREDVVFEKEQEVVEKMSNEYDEDDYKTKINKLGVWTNNSIEYIFISRNSTSSKYLNKSWYNVNKHN